MAVRIGFLGVAHMHAWGYLGALREHPDVEVTGAFDPQPERLAQFATGSSFAKFDTVGALLDASDAVVICSPNTQHAADTESAAAAGKHILCEKPIVTSELEFDRMKAAVSQSRIKFMTAFPCRFSPAFARLKQRVSSGEIGELVGICATNRGRCPFDWFVQKPLSGGGAIIDHVVHVSDLLWELLGVGPVKVHCASGNGMYREDFEDTAMLTLEYESGLFATLDSSWSRPASFKTWGDVTMSVVGEKGVIELDLFGPAVDVFSSQGLSHSLAGYGADLDMAIVAEFVDAIQRNRDPNVSLDDGWRAVQVALMAYASASSGQPISISA